MGMSDAVAQSSYVTPAAVLTADYARGLRALPPVRLYASQSGNGSASSWREESSSSAGANRFAVRGAGGAADAAWAVNAGPAAGVMSRSAVAAVVRPARATSWSARL